MENEASVSADAGGPAPAACAVNGVAPAQVAVPTDRVEAAAWVVRAREAGWGLVARGTGSQLDFGFPPQRLDLVLSTERLNRVVDYQPDDMTVTVEPGVPLSALQTLLATRGQFLPLDPPGAERTTLGGVVATAASGPWRAAYGTPRDWLIGCRVVGSDGKEVRGGGQVVKNVAGYDLPKLYTGSFGTLGLLTELTFKVMPKPAAQGCVLVHLPSPRAVEALLASTLDSDVQPAALELLHRQVVEDAGGEGDADHDWIVLAQFLHVQDAVEWQQEQFLALARKADGAGAPLSPERGAALLAAAREFPYAHAFTARLGTTSSRTAEVAARAADISRRHGLPPRIACHAATGQIFVGGEGETVGALVRELRDLAQQHGATCLFPRLPAPLWGAVDPWGEPGPELRLLRGLKQVLDPTNLFSPGRFVGGL